MPEPRSFFVPGDDDSTFIPTKWSSSAWGPDQLNGPAVCAVVARAIEHEFADPDFVPARLTIDLFKAARNRPTVVTTAPVRSGRRIIVADAEVRQDDVTVARATAVFLRRSAPPPGAEWQPSAAFSPPTDESERNTLRHPRLQSGDGEWTRDFGAHQNASRKRAWSTAMPVLPNEPASSFVHAVQSAESTSLVTNLGTDGIGYINCDLTMALSRMPEGAELGIEADSHITADGISVGTATLYDRKGPYGTGMVTAVSNPAAQIDFSSKSRLV